MVENTKLLIFKEFSDAVGALIPLESLKEIPFAVKRIYYIYGVPKGITRGFHSHKLLEQVLICVHGSVKIRIKTFYEEDIVALDSPDKGLFIGPMVWREMFEFTDDAVLLVLASEYYTELDYIRDFNSYLDAAKVYFKKS